MQGIREADHINADDVLKVLDEMEFSEFVEPLRTSLQGQSCCLHRVSTLLDGPWYHRYVKVMQGITTCV